MYIYIYIQVSFNKFYFSTSIKNKWKKEILHLQQAVFYNNYYI